MLHVLKLLEMESHLFRNHFTNIQKSLILILNKKSDKSLVKIAAEALGTLINVQTTGASY